MKIEKIDKNFMAQTADGLKLEYFSAAEPPMEVDGLPWFYENREYRRIPQQQMAGLSEELQCLAANTSGGMVRFRTDSTSIGVKAELSGIVDMPHMTRIGSSGFDIYLGAGKEKRFAKMAVSLEHTSKIDSVPLTGLDREEKEVTIHFPLYNGLKSVFVGLDAGSHIKAPSPYRVNKPVLFYGSSITQGACASRPGNAYTARIGRMLNVPVTNFGFSGNARGELQMAHILSSLPMSCLVIDYDHNAPDSVFLERTYEPFFKAVREKHPDLPVIFVSRPDFYKTEEDKKRREVIRLVYENAKNNKDKNVFFVDGEMLFGTADRYECTVDGCHPNDLGFYRMAKGIGAAVEKALFSTII